MAKGEEEANEMASMDVYVKEVREPTGQAKWKMEKDVADGTFIKEICMLVVKPKEAQKGKSMDLIPHPNKMDLKPYPIHSHPFHQRGGCKNKFVYVGLTEDSEDESFLVGESSSYQPKPFTLGVVKITMKEL